MRGVQNRKRKMVDELIEFHLSKFKGSGAELIMGEGRFVGPKTLRVQSKSGDARQIVGERIFLDPGTRATVPDSPGLSSTRPMTHIEVLNLDRTPGHLLVLGGGYVGLELAQAMKRLGSQVTVIEVGSQLANREDQDVGDALLDLFRAEGIEVLLGANVVEFGGTSGRNVWLHVDQSGRARTVAGTDLLVATGRTPTALAPGPKWPAIRI